MIPHRAIALILCTVTLDALAIGLMIPVLPRILIAFMGGDTAGAAEILGLFTTVWALMQFVSAPVLCVLSDQVGRRPVILISCLGLGLDYMFMAVAPSLWLLLLGRVISGVTAATITTSYAYIADVTPEANRARVFGLLGVSFSVGFIVGPAVGGLLAGIEPRLPFWLSAVACLINAGFGWFVLPESLPRERRMPFSWARANPFGAFRLLSRHRELFSLAMVNFLGQLAHQVLPAVTVLYTGYRYGWTETDVGLTLAFVGVCGAVVMGLLVDPAVKRLGERGCLILGVAGGAAGMVIYGLAPNGWTFLIGAPVMALWGLAGPALVGMMSRMVSSSEQGQLYGANTSLTSIATLVGPGLFAFPFAALLEQLPGVSYDLAALILLLSLAVAWWTTRTPRAADPPR